MKLDHAAISLLLALALGLSDSVWLFYWICSEVRSGLVCGCNDIIRSLSTFLSGSGYVTLALMCILSRK